MLSSAVFNPVFSRNSLALLSSCLLVACNSADNSSFTDLSGVELTDPTTEGGVPTTGGELQDVMTEVTPAVTLSWVAPVEREDGTPLSMSEIAGYKLYYGTAEGQYTHEIAVNSGSTMEVTLSGLAPGDYYMVITTVDMDGRESANSQEITRSI